MRVAERFAIDLSEDIARVYLKDVGKIPAMTASEERKISGNISNAEERQRNILFSIPQVIDELARIGTQLEDGSIGVVDILKDADSFARSKTEEKLQNQETITCICEIRRHYHRLNEISRTLSRAHRSDTPALIADREKTKAELQERISSLNINKETIERIVESIARNIKHLTPAEQGSLLSRLREIRDMETVIYEKKERLIQGNLRLVINIAKKYQNRGLDLMDLIQEGNIGLMRAADKYDHRKGYKFTTYATWWIRQTMVRAISNSSNIIKIPIHVIETKTKIGKTISSLIQELEREPDLKEISERSGYSPQKIKEVMTVPEPAVSLETIVGDNDTTIGDFLADLNGRCALKELVNGSLKEELRKVLSTLTKSEEKVIRMRFGLNRLEGCTLAEIGNSLKITREYVRQIELKAMKRLRHPVRRRVLESFQE